MQPLGGMHVLVMRPVALTLGLWGPDPNPGAKSSLLALQARKDAGRGPGAVAHACNQHFGNPSEADHLRPGVQGQPEQNVETPFLLQKKKRKEKKNGPWWWVPVIPATRKAEAGESLEYGRRRLQ